MYIDTHCHVLDPRFDTDRDAVLERAGKNGVTAIIEVGCETGDWAKILEFARSRPRTYCALGIHPHEAKDASYEDMKNLQALAKLPEVVAIGETGMDYYYKLSPRDVQVTVFQSHLALARAAGKPLVIHCRDAYVDLINILEGDIKLNGRLAGVIHCFSGSTDDARRLVSQGFFIGIDGPVTYPSAKVLRETVKEIPIEHILLETDSPYLAPQVYRGKRNEPSYLPETAKAVAEIKNIPAETVAEITTANAKKLFNLKVEI